MSQRVISMGDYQYRVVIYGVAVSKTDSHDYTLIDETFTVDSDVPLSEEDIISSVLDQFERQNQRLTRYRWQADAGINRVDFEEVFGIEEEQSDYQWLKNRGIISKQPIVRDSRGRFVSNKELLRNLKLDNMRTLDDIPTFKTEKHSRAKKSKKTKEEGQTRLYYEE